MFSFQSNIAFVSVWCVWLLVLILRLFFSHLFILPRSFPSLALHLQIHLHTHKTKYSMRIISRWHSSFLHRFGYLMLHTFIQESLYILWECVLCCAHFFIRWSLTSRCKRNKKNFSMPLQCHRQRHRYGCYLFDKMCPIVFVVIESFYWIMKLTKNSIFKSLQLYQQMKCSHFSSDELWVVWFVCFLFANAVLGLQHCITTNLQTNLNWF